MKRTLASILALLATSAAAGNGSVAGSKHDFSASGPGPIRAKRETSPCSFCHASHRAGPRTLSNRPDPRMAERSYESTTMTGRAGPVEGSSRLCLSCHDGTIAVGATRTKVIPMDGGQDAIAPGRRGYLGTDLRTSHPVSVRVAGAGRTHAPPKGDKVQLDGGQLVQCTSCHDPHAEWGDPTLGKFLVKPSANSALCLSCHDPGVGAGAPSVSHLAAARFPTTAAAAASAAGGCGTCHVMHGADSSRGQLLRSDLPGDALCLACHGEGSTLPVAVQWRQPFGHGLPFSGRHDAGEGPHAQAYLRLPESSPGAPRHASCVDCHNPHASNAIPSAAPGVGGALAGVWGIDLQGNQITPSRYQYEVCFKCHADSANKPQDSGAGLPGDPRRANADFNLRRVFSPGAISSHPVATAPRGGLSPSLKPQVAASQILCSDCHSSDLAAASPSAGLSTGRPVGGPHGSAFRHILARQYLTADFTAESPDAYALCYGCHAREVLLSKKSTFPHAKHVVDHSGPCSACHDAHGISALSGRPDANAHLISFDLEIVKGGQGQLPKYQAAGVGSGSCNLTCHGVLHAPGRKAYSY